MYDVDFKLSGAKISFNMLESNRVYAAKLNESNFHVFYALVLGASNEILKDIGLDQQTSYKVCRLFYILLLKIIREYSTP